MIYKILLLIVVALLGIWAVIEDNTTMKVSNYKQVPTVFVLSAITVLYYGLPGIFPKGPLIYFGICFLFLLLTWKIRGGADNDAIIIIILTNYLLFNELYFEVILFITLLEFTFAYMLGIIQRIIRGIQNNTPARKMLYFRVKLPFLWCLYIPFLLGSVVGLILFR